MVALDRLPCSPIGIYSENTKPEYRINVQSTSSISGLTLVYSIFANFVANHTLHKNESI